MRESTIEKYLVKRVKELGGEVRKVQWVGRNSAPDRFVMLPPLPFLYMGQDVPNQIWVELKAPGKKPTAAQTREHNLMRNMGQRVEIVDSLERVDEVLK